MRTTGGRLTNRAGSYCTGRQQSDRHSFRSDFLATNYESIWKKWGYIHTHSTRKLTNSPKVTLNHFGEKSSFSKHPEFRKLTQKLTKIRYFAASSVAYFGEEYPLSICGFQGFEDCMLAEHGRQSLASHLQQGSLRSISGGYWDLNPVYRYISQGQPLHLLYFCIPFR